ncbi:hypothetical protein [Aliihoeflea sp. 40Bstr573]|uniref:hypothetical protein n=1 Tax=Aliihoeflea sp. 40Bstr573 TaxID=2696467 RepID=UPI00209576F5|nr:hypothetical protein [Aliihoeflea sp. 40Bstr573]
MAFFTTDQLSALSSSTVRLDILVKMEFKSGTVYVWNGNTDLETGGQTWRPMHGRGTIDGIGISSGTVSEAVTLTLSGLPEQQTDLLALALEESPDVAQQSVTIYVQLFGDDWQPIGAPIGIWWGFMQPPRVERSQMQGIEGAQQAVSVVAENAFFNRSRPPYGRYTDRDQQKRYPGDKFFQFMSSLLFKTFVYPDY